MGRYASLKYKNIVKNDRYIPNNIRIAKEYCDYMSRFIDDPRYEKFAASLVEKI